MGYHPNPERLNAEVQRFLEKDRLPERRMWPVSGPFQSVPEDRGTEAFRALYDRAKKFDGWPGDKWQEPIGHHRNPFLRQSKNLTLAAIILTDPTRQQEAYGKLLEAGYTSDAAKAILSKHHETLNISEDQ